MKLNKSTYLLLLFFVFFFQSNFKTFADSIEIQRIDDRVSHLLEIKSESEKIDSLIIFGRQLRNFFPERAIDIFNECINLSQKNNLPDKMVNGLIQISTVYIVHFNWDSSQFYIDKSIYVADSLKLSYFLAKAYRIKAIIFQRSGYYNTSINFLRKSILSLNDKDSVLLSRIYNTLGIAYEQLGELDSATYYYLNSFSLLDDSMKKSEGPDQLINLSDIFAKLKNIKKSRQLLQEAIDLLGDRNGNTYLKQRAMIYNKFGSVYYFEKLYDSALIFFRKSGVLYKELNLFPPLSNVYSNIGATYLETGKYDSALYYFNMAKSEINSVSQDITLGSLYNNISIVYMRQEK